MFRLALVKCYPGNHDHPLFFLLFLSSSVCLCLSPLFHCELHSAIVMVNVLSAAKGRSVGPFPMTHRLNAPLVFMMSTQIKIIAMLPWTSFHWQQAERLLLVFSLQPTTTLPSCRLYVRTHSSILIHFHSLKNWRIPSSTRIFIHPAIITTLSGCTVSLNSIAFIITTTITSIIITAMIVEKGV